MNVIIDNPGHHHSLSLASRWKLQQVIPLPKKPLQRDSQILLTFQISSENIKRTPKTPAFDLIAPIISACRLAEWMVFLDSVVMATVVTCRVRNPACTAASALGKERYING